jgi:hypothetical protein
MPHSVIQHRDWISDSTEFRDIFTGAPCSLFPLLWHHITLDIKVEYLLETLPKLRYIENQKKNYIDLKYRNENTRCRYAEKAVILGNKNLSPQGTSPAVR